MSKLPVTLKSTKFLKEIQARIAFFANHTIAFRIVVPDDLKFWYWLEFGTAGRQDAAAPHKTAHSGTYPIDPINAHTLKFDNRFTFHVDHPGIRPRLIYRGIRKDILRYAQEAISKAFISTGVRFYTVELALGGDIMPHALEEMGLQLDRQAPNTRVDGKLNGKTAGQVWRDEATIVKV